MKTILIRTGIVLGIFVLLAGLWVTNNFIYPFQSVHPNYADVEKAFARLQFPSDWQEISSSENRGIHGRNCDPLNSSGCFHKSKTFKVLDVERAKTDAISMMKTQTTCKGLVEETYPEGNSNTSPETGISLSCQEASGGVSYSTSISQKRGEVSVGTRSF